MEGGRGEEEGVKREERCSYKLTSFWEKETNQTIIRFLICHGDDRETVLGV